MFNDQPPRKVAKLTYEPDCTADQVILRSFGASKPTTPFVRVHPPAAIHSRPLSQQGSSGASGMPSPIAALKDGGGGGPLRKGRSFAGGLPRGSSRGADNNASSNTPSASAAPRKPVIPPISTKTRWFPLESPRPVVGKPLAPNDEASVSSPRAFERANTRRDRIKALIEVMPANMHSIVNAMALNMDDEGNISTGEFNKCLVEMLVNPTVTNTTMLDGVSVSTPVSPAAGGGTPLSSTNGAKAATSTTTSVSFVATDVEESKTIGALLFYKLKAYETRDFRLPVYVLLAALDTVINNEEVKMSARQDCFDLFNLDNRGYVHKADIDKIKHLKMPMERETQRTPHMVKVLSDMFISVLKAEEEQFIASQTKGKGKKKKLPALRPYQKSIIPINMMRIAHINFATFNKYFELNPELPEAFIPCWIRKLELPAERSTRLNSLMHQRIDELNRKLFGGGATSQTTSAAPSTTPTPR